MKKLIRKILRESFIVEANKSFFRRVKLPYDYKSMKDFVGYETMWEHYNKHYKGYTTKLNDALSKRKNPTTNIEKIIRGIKNYDTFTRNNAGGYYNQRQFDDESGKVFGSGWCWLVLKNGRLKIVTTPNQDNPLMDNLGEPLLGLDVWEHAYYLNYMSDRKKYINNFWKVVNWEKVSNKYGEIN
jgi:Fe-Mn family superoxide dismutase